MSLDLAGPDFDGALILGKELRRDRERALRELNARSAAAAVAFRRGLGQVATLEAPLDGQEEAGSVIVARMLVDHGVPEDRIYTEQTTRSTREEAVEGRRVAQALGWRRTLVVTSAYHLPRARRYFRDLFGDSAEVVAPEALLPYADPRAAAAIRAGVPHPAAMREEAKVEFVFSALATALRPLPDPLRFQLEIQAGGLWRGVDGARRRAAR